MYATSPYEYSPVLSTGYTLPLIGSVLAIGPPVTHLGGHEASTADHAAKFVLFARTAGFVFPAGAIGRPVATESKGKIGEQSETTKVDQKPFSIRMTLRERNKTYMSGMHLPSVHINSSHVSAQFHSSSPVEQSGFPSHRRSARRHWPLEQRKSVVEGHSVDSANVRL